MCFTRHEYISSSINQLTNKLVDTTDDQNKLKPKCIMPRDFKIVLVSLKIKIINLLKLFSVKVCYS